MGDVIFGRLRKMIDFVGFSCFLLRHMLTLSLVKVSLINVEHLLCVNKEYEFKKY